MRFRIILLIFWLFPLVGGAHSGHYGDQEYHVAASDWHEIVALARGQEVHWYAWGGSDLYNGYMAWAAREVESRFGVEVSHVKLADTAEAVRQVLAEKSAGVGATAGAIDVIWINGENFAAMKKHELLFGPFVAGLPHFSLVDTEASPTTVYDFTIPTDGLEAPWGMAQLIFIYDSATHAGAPPMSAEELLAYAKANPGRLAYPAPPDFLGTTFLKQLLLTLVDSSEHSVFYAPPTDANFAEATAPLWSYLEALTPYLMRGGRYYPKGGEELLDLLDNGNIDLAFSFNVGAVAAAQEQGRLAETARPYVWRDGSPGNSHFLAIPYNAKSKEGAQVLINFLLSPLAQARKADSRYWGEPSVLSYARLNESQRRWFDAIPESPSILRQEQLGRALSEPHPQWTERIEAEWLKRFAS